MLRKLWQGWKRIARQVGDFQARVLLTIIYAVLVLPFGLVVRFFADPLRVKRTPEAWIHRSDQPADMNWAHKQW